MSNVSLHALERSIRAMQLGGVLALDKRRADLGYDGLQELELQFQIPISGLATSIIGWTPHTVDFDVDFFFAPEQRDSPLTMPQFTYGAVIEGDNTVDNPLGAVGVLCTVQNWKKDGRAAIIGANLLIGVTAGVGQVSFDGYVHLSFHGYGAPSESTAAQDIGT